MAYHYTECGLENVWLENGYQMHDTDYGPAVSFSDADALHRVIGSLIIESARPLNGAEVRFLRGEMDLSQKRLGLLLGLDEQTVRRWEKLAESDIPGAPDRLIRQIYAEYVNTASGLRKLLERLAAHDRDEITEIRLRDVPGEGWKRAA